MKETQTELQTSQSLPALKQELAETRDKLRSQSYLNPLERHKMVAKIRLINSTIAMLEAYNMNLNSV